MSFFVDILEAIGDFYYSLMIKDYKSLQDDIKLIAVAIYTDEKRKDQEISKATEILKADTGNSLSVEEYDVLMHKVEVRIKKYEKDYQFFLKEKFDLIETIVTKKDVKKAKKMKDIFLSDGNISKDERQALLQLEAVIDEKKQKENNE